MCVCVCIIYVYSPMLNLLYLQILIHKFKNIFVKIKTIFNQTQLDKKYFICTLLHEPFRRYIIMPNSNLVRERERERNR